MVGDQRFLPCRRHCLIEQAAAAGTLGLVNSEGRNIPANPRRDPGEGFIIFLDRGGPVIAERDLVVCFGRGDGGGGNERRYGDDERFGNAEHDRSLFLALGQPFVAAWTFWRVGSAKACGRADCCLMEI